MESTPNFSKLLFFISFTHFFLANGTPFLPKEALPTKSGYLPINPTSISAIFFTFYEAQNPISHLSQTPLLVWLEGGPGCSSMIANFFGLGPWRLNSDGQDEKNPVLKPNSGAWNHIFGLVFLDNPIGTGFSIASSPEEIPKDQDTVAKHLFVALRSFISLDPSFNSRPIYITGESYAGKYVPAIGYYILQQNSRLPVSRQVKLRGIAIGNGLTDPQTQITILAAMAYFSGLINEKQRTRVEEIQDEAARLAREGKWREASDALIRVANLLQNMTGLATLFDIRRMRPYETEVVSVLLQNEEVKKALGVNKSMVWDWEACSDIVDGALHEDVMKSVKFMVEELVKKSKVLLYQGQFDLTGSVVSNEAWVKEMKWEELHRFLMAERNVWKVNGELAGYVQKWGSLSHVVVSGAGHLVYADQAFNSRAMIEDWVLERGLYM
ncbi:hypothetical protein HHK36_029976 [Tetracentron sinense]|uniref:Carboxypeptidase n=1 Tax=Tetracentron sinense TaxID=13715 RepID=A0A835D036_TETSI|nr:hypothetical protein HHK36_029976 [Tetracentron sinense]